MNAFSFLSAFRSRREPAARLPHGEMVYAIGDVHGRADLLAELLDRIALDEAERGAAATQIIFLGDLVDRGPDSRRVLDLVLALEQTRRVRLLRGNHDEVFRRAAAGDPRSTRALHKMGGRATLLSYGISAAEYAATDYDDLTEHLRQLVPPEHLDLLDRMENMIVLGDYVFVHAGVRPGVPLGEQMPEDLFWIRREFLDHRGDFGGVVVHGHSIVADVDVRANRIGIDTGAYESNKLTAIGLQEAERWFLST